MKELKPESCQSVHSPQLEGCKGGIRVQVSGGLRPRTLRYSCGFCHGPQNPRHCRILAQGLCYNNPALSTPSRQAYGGSVNLGIKRGPWVWHPGDHCPPLPGGQWSFQITCLTAASYGPLCGPANTSSFLVFKSYTLPPGALCSSAILPKSRR